MCVIRRHFGGSELTAGGTFFSRNTVALGWVPAVRGTRFFVKYWWASGGSLLSGGGIIIFRVIRMHFLVAAVDPAVSLSTYNPCSMEFVP